MENPNAHDTVDSGLVFAAYNNHDAHCGLPPGLRNSDHAGLYYAYFENRYGEQFVFTFDRATRTGTVSGGDLDWGNPISFTLVELDQAIRDSRTVGTGHLETSDSPTIDAALMLGRLTGLTGKDEVLWLRACLEVCTAFTSPTRRRLK